MIVVIQVLLLAISKIVYILVLFEMLYVLLVESDLRERL